MNRFSVAFVSALTALALQACEEEPQPSSKPAVSESAKIALDVAAPEVAAPEAKPQLQIQKIVRLDGLGEGTGTRGGASIPVSIKLRDPLPDDVTNNDVTNEGAGAGTVTLANPGGSQNAYLPFDIRCLPESEGHTYKITFTVTDSFGSDDEHGQSEPQELTITCSGCSGNGTCHGGDPNSHCGCAGNENSATNCNGGETSHCVCNTGYYQQATNDEHDGVCDVCVDNFDAYHCKDGIKVACTAKNTDLSCNDCATHYTGSACHDTCLSLLPTTGDKPHHCKDVTYETVTCNQNGENLKCTRQCDVGYYGDICNEACKNVSTVHAQCDTTSVENVSCAKDGSYPICLRCNPNYYKNGSGGCIVCQSSTVLHCDGYEACDPTSTTDTAHCTSCASGYYNSSTAPSTVTCTPCPQINDCNVVVTCSKDSNSRCTQCTSDHHRVAATGDAPDTCPACKTWGELHCQSADKYVGCEAGATSDTAHCTECDTAHHYYKLYSDSTQFTCVLYSDAQVSGKYVKEGVWSSSCGDGYYISDTTHRLCSRCSDSCATCSGSAGHCLSCKANSSYPFLSGNSCIACPGRCSSCNGSSSCTGCKTGYQGLTCSQCSSGYFNAGSSSSPDCQSCQVTDCAECTAARKCTRCNQGQVINSGQTCCYISGCQTYGNTVCECLD